MTSMLKVLELMNRNEKKNALITLFAIVIMAALDTLGVASVMPFISLLSNPGEIQDNKLLSFFYINLNFDDQKSFLFFVGCCVFIILLCSLVFKALVTYLQLRFSFMLEHSISSRLFELYLSQQYIWFLDQNTSNLSKTILSEVQQLINFAVIPGMYAIANGAVSIGLISLLLIIEPGLTIFCTLILGILYFGLYSLTKNFLDEIGIERSRANEKRFSIVTEALNAITQIKVGVFESLYHKKYKRKSSSYATVQASSQIIAQIPRYGLEICVFGGMILVLLFMMRNDNDLLNVLPTLVVFAFATYKLIPALQHLYAGISQLRFTKPLIIKIKDDLKNLENSREKKSDDKKVLLNETIILKNISFSYPKSREITCKNINATLKSKQVIGLAGESGSGKSTLARIIIGILNPQKGEIIVDDIKIDSNNVNGWKKNVGYVPQNVYLAEKSVAENIAFNIPVAKIDNSRIIWSAKLAGLHKTVQNTFDNGYDTIIGERGQKISGGQIQRIAIARALYNKPQLLIFDEATSALDSATENDVLKSLVKLKKNITVIIITHRLVTLKQCDNILFIKKGILIAEGTYDKLLKTSSEFKILSSI